MKMNCRILTLMSIMLTCIIVTLYVIISEQYLLHVHKVDSTENIVDSTENIVDSTKDNSNNLTNQNSNPTILILMIATVNRMTFIDIQKPYLESHDGIHFMTYHEHNFSFRCDDCKNAPNILELEMWELELWCAHKRTLLVLDDYFRQNEEIPDFVLIIHEDTFVNVVNLKAFVKTLRSSEMLYIGSVMVGNNNRKHEAIAERGGALISRPVLEKIKSNISNCVTSSQIGKWCHYNNSDLLLALCIKDFSRTKPKMSLLFKQNTSTPNECHHSYVTCHGFKNSFEMGQTYIMYGSDTESRGNNELDLSTESRIGLLQNCHFYIPVNDSKWPEYSHYFEEWKFNSTKYTYIHDDYYLDMKAIIDGFSLKYNFHDIQKKFRVLYGDINYCSECFPVISISRPVTCGLNMLSWIHYGRHFEVVNNEGANMLKKLDIPYLSKKDIAVWRGVTTGAWSKNFSEILIYPDFTRQLFVTKYYNSSDNIDIGLSECFDQSPGAILGVTHYNCSFSNYVKGKKTIKDLLKYKFLIALQGNDVASGLKWMLSSNSVVFTPSPITMETWSLEPSLKPWVHYVPLKFDGSDLEEKIMHATENPDQMMMIVKNAKQYIGKFLNFYSQKNRAIDELKFYADRVHISSDIDKHSIECESRANNSWLRSQLRNCNLKFY